MDDQYEVCLFSQSRDIAPVKPRDASGMPKAVRPLLLLAAVDLMASNQDDTR